AATANAPAAATVHTASIIRLHEKKGSQQACPSENLTGNLALDHLGRCHHTTRSVSGRHLPDVHLKHPKHRHTNPVSHQHPYSQRSQYCTHQHNRRSHDRSSKSHISRQTHIPGKKS